MLQGRVKMGCPQWINAGRSPLDQQLDDGVDRGIVRVVAVEQRVELDPAEAGAGRIKQPARRLDRMPGSGVRPDQAVYARCCARDIRHEPVVGVKDEA